MELRSFRPEIPAKDHIENRRGVLLRLVSEPEPGVIPVFKRASGGNVPLLRGKGGETLLCGNCDQELAVEVDREELPRLIFRCPGCGYFNDTE